MGRRAPPSTKKLPEFLGLPLRAFAQAGGEQRCANTGYHTHVCSRQTTGARTSRNELLGVRADPVGTPWGVSALIVGGARIRADMRLRSKQQRRAMNAEFSNGICLA